MAGPPRRGLPGEPLGPGQFRQHLHRLRPGDDQASGPRLAASPGGGLSHGDRRAPDRQGAELRPRHPAGRAPRDDPALPLGNRKLGSRESTRAGALPRQWAERAAAMAAGAFNPGRLPPSTAAASPGPSARAG